MPGAIPVGPVEHAVWRGIELARPVALTYAVVMVVLHQEDMRRPWVAWTALAVLGCWVALAGLRRWRSREAVLVELGLVCVAILLTTLVHTRESITAGATTIPAMYAAIPVAAAAAVAGVRGGLLAAAAVTCANVWEVGRPTGGTIYNTLLLLLLATAMGAGVELGRRHQAALAESTRLRAEAAERERLARMVHDGVLQHLAFIHRRGLQLGGEAAELGDLAARSEADLRRLMATGGEAGRSASGGGTDRVQPAGPVDIRPALQTLGGPRTEVAVPATPVTLTRHRAAELVAAVAACLDNVARHAGDDARAWVLLEDLGERVELTVRDDGPGIEPGRLEAAAAQGRLGVASSIRGRVQDLGGRVTYRGGPGRGTVVHLSVPRTPEEPG
ncbi:MacS family sensor histidine kinase [Arsenicicoccus dermatophilus]|uniref:MacS family sensor histidine kinase n=1 Tax=Arsenicicoccus dermatophilus TaxID=1076331 RepID=UPI003916E458